MGAAYGQQAQDFFWFGSLLPVARAKRSESKISPAFICLSFVRIYKYQSFRITLKTHIVIFTLLTKDLAASSMLTFSLADVSNHPAKPCSFTYSSSLAGVVTIPCFC